MDWLKEINAAITICDKQGIIVYMNEKSEQVFKNDGGKNLSKKRMQKYFYSADQKKMN